MRTGGVEGVLIECLHRSGGGGLLDLVPGHHRGGELERAVLDQLGVEPAVGTEIDVLKEDAYIVGLIFAPADPPSRSIERGCPAQAGRPEDDAQDGDDAATQHDPVHGAFS
jgi:hypothetical protein